MKKTINSRLREHTTNIAFHLTLTKAMIVHLVLMHYLRGDPYNMHHNGIEKFTRSFVVTMRCLEQRGLMHWAVPVYSSTTNYNGGPIIDHWKPYRLTRAGTLVVNLLKEAGVYQDCVAELKLDELFKEQPKAESA